MVDGNRCPRLPIPAEAVVKGDGKIASIAAASILAKTVRDAGMLACTPQYPMYGFDRHMGYPTAAHCARWKRTAPRRCIGAASGRWPTVVVAVKLIQSRDNPFFKQL
jgi:ribonuclease HII